MEKFFQEWKNIHLISLELVHDFDGLTSVIPDSKWKKNETSQLEFMTDCILLRVRERLQLFSDDEHSKLHRRKIEKKT